MIKKKRVTKYIIQNTETKRLYIWSLRQVVNEINRDRSDQWTPYNSRDWAVGWKHFVEEDEFCNLKMVGKVRVE